jgi:hypothetical protein
VTPPPTQVEAVEQIQRIDTKKVQFQGIVQKLKRNWGKNVAKQHHKQCNEKAYIIAKSTKKAERARGKLERWKERRRIHPAQAQPDKTMNDWKIGTGVVDSGTTSTVIRPEDKKYVTETSIPSNKVFIVANGGTTKGGNQAILHNGLRGTACQADIVPDLKHNSLISTSKWADAGYYTVFTPTEVHVYDGKPEPTKIPVMEGWRDPESGLWRVPLVNNVKNVNTETRLCTAEETAQIVRRKS